MAGQAGQTFARTGVPPSKASFDVFLDAPVAKDGRELDRAVAAVVVATAAMNFLLVRSLDIIQILE
jgi:hypothetical protein